MFLHEISAHTSRYYDTHYDISHCISCATLYSEKYRGIYLKFAVVLLTGCKYIYVKKLRLNA